jgi:hypothetical protein
MKTEHLPPTDQGYEDMARVLLSSIISDAPFKRHKAVAKQLAGVVALVKYFGEARQPARIERLQAYLASFE